MPQKRNPWNCENVKSMWKAFAPRVLTFCMDQISEHQRDLTNSASGRFVAEYVAGLAAAAARMRDVLRELGVDRSRMAANLGHTRDGVLAEPLYILLALAGVADAHEAVRQITLASERDGIPLRKALEGRPELLEAVKGSLERVGLGDPAAFFANPAGYRGISARKARDLAASYGERMRELKRRLGERTGV